ncbi:MULTISPECIES: bifunctional methylenetetrahydrofolate dehydrogenase/methenyltetrahydrofolate cyclohydrolase FolD [unclassified Sporosarcina]|uniref:bifunctional methylenetetrahydrofolate dehydrogenase/methenyltetrahydrofolate cyclohydrolase FolD n=1 Tax=unclassified Sporosarcina TaxID=2647733 RepID=UPI000C173633|nr:MULTISPECIES: bifunctional methylenetetrahydrofolate dehydrogenase/methenyltetrahydrofolate cyclohydrolase FolD [unclassified Sporosarcina]PID06619.1 bifunctional methylenetetrahydrofolate dehydrogenase/methenyltetrahydrofolate cyclohydrolase FolD [Sporosarcina sp. P30]PID09813.1 bifunctional methylenetetrahydrofolate dehydrogenase/methenyltetrahydrofolate cyclohydrolase FolD [Sporosarcina sp. P31]PID13392.1 bifunctional methylenetetrahydrofolate dehydrogenase/methenyltetrahydrofolate cyclohy
MSSKKIDGKAIGQEIRNELKEEVASLVAQGVQPGLAVILVGENSASETYVRNKEKSSKEAGMKSVLTKLPDTVSEEELLAEVEKLNQDDTIDGILVQLPLPKHIDENKVIRAISPEKDVDGFHPMNVGKMLIGQETFLPCTPYGIMQLLERSNVEIAGKHAVIIGRSNIVGKPMGQLLLQKDATVTYCHSRTEDLKKFTLQADILIVAIGMAKFITGDYIKEGAVVIDVGMNRDENGKLCGDVDYESAEKQASAITPVPGGVGPMTITMLLKNTVESAENKLKARTQNK